MGKERRRPEGAVCQVGGVQGNRSRKRGVEIRGHANSSQRGKDKTPEIVIYGEDEPSVTGGSGNDESWDGSRDTRPRTKAQELCASSEPEAPQPTSQSASNSRITIPDPSDTYLAPQFQESINQVARATMDEINRTSLRTLGRIVNSQRLDRSLSSSERTSRAIVPTEPARGETALKSRVVASERTWRYATYLCK